MRNNWRKVVTAIAVLSLAMGVLTACGSSKKTDGNQDVPGVNQEGTQEIQENQESESVESEVIQEGQADQDDLVSEEASQLESGSESPDTQVTSEVSTEVGNEGATEEVLASPNTQVTSEVSVEVGNEGATEEVKSPLATMEEILAIPNAQVMLEYHEKVVTASQVEQALTTFNGKEHYEIRVISTEGDSTVKPGAKYQGDVYVNDTGVTIITFTEIVSNK